MRLIDADRLLEPRRIGTYYHLPNGDIAIPLIDIEHAPSIDAVDAVEHGIWIEENTRTRSSKFYCSVCHRTAYDPQPTRIAGWVKRCRYVYCPNCGARMDGEQDE